MNEKPLIMIVEDNPGVSLNLKVALNYNGYEVATAENGKEGISLLNKMEKLPEVIISDIMMPIMNGYDLFKYLSENSRWSQIPFIFLTARADPDDIRIGKLLGADDYITKPFKEEDLLAVISGKIKRNKNIKAFRDKLEKELGISKIEEASISIEEKESVIIFVIFWDERHGPLIKKKIPENVDLPISLGEIGTQLFMAANTIYGYTTNTAARGILLEIANVKKFGYLYFDSIQDKEVRGGIRRYVISLLAPHITYYDSLKIKTVFKDLSSKIKNLEDYEMKNQYNTVIKILTKE